MPRTHPYQGEQPTEQQETTKKILEVDGYDEAISLLAASEWKTSGTLQIDESLISVFSADEHESPVIGIDSIKDGMVVGLGWSGVDRDSERFRFVGCLIGFYGGLGLQDGFWLFCDVLGFHFNQPFECLLLVLFLLSILWIFTLFWFAISSVGQWILVASNDILYWGLVFFVRSLVL